MESTRVEKIKAVVVLFIVVFAITFTIVTVAMFLMSRLAHAEDRYGNGGANLRWAQIGVYRCADNLKDRISRGVIPYMTKQERVDWCVKDYIKQYQQSVETSEKLIEGLTRGTDPYLSYRPSSPPVGEEDLRKSIDASPLLPLR